MTTNRPHRAIRAFVVDDHELVRRGVREVLTASGIEVVGEAGTGTQALAEAPAARPDVVLLDVGLPDGSGVEVCRALRTLVPDVRVLMVTSYDDPSTVRSALAAGAHGYVLKQAASRLLLDAVETVAHGGTVFDPEAAREAAEEMRSAGSSTDPLLGSLTPQELRIIDLIVDGRTNREIGDELHLGEQTVKNYVSRILAKLGVTRRTQAAVYGAAARSRATEESP